MIADLSLAFVSLMMWVLAVILLYGITVIAKRLDRYRLKYGFDREIEAKDTKNNTQERLDKREKRFKERTYKD